MLTIKLFFFLETKDLDVNFKDSNVLHTKEIHPKITYINRNNFKVSMGNKLFETRVPKFLKNYEINDDFETFDFFNANFLKLLLMHRYNSKVFVDKIMKIRNKKGYVLEVVASFPKNSDFHKNYLKDLHEKAQIYFNI